MNVKLFEIFVQLIFQITRQSVPLSL